MTVCGDIFFNSGLDMRFRVDGLSGTATKMTVLCLMTASNGARSMLSTVLSDDDVAGSFRDEMSTFIPRLRAS